MNKVHALLIASAMLMAACSTAPSKPAAPPAPAATNISGTWIVTTQTQMGAQDTTMKVVQTGKDLKGTLETPMGNSDYTGSIDGNNAKWGFNFNAQGMDLRIEYVGVVEGGNSMKGTATFGTFGEGAFTAKKQ